LNETQTLFSGKAFLALVCFSCLLLVLLGTILFHFIDRQLHHDLGQRARVQASEIALMPGLAIKSRPEISPVSPA
jgi:two-component system cit operon sensor histidine kinase CitA